MGSKRKFALAGVVSALIAGTTLASVAFATAPSGQVGVVLDRGTTSVPINYSVPKEVTVTQKVRVKIKGKFVTRTKKVTRIVDVPVVACSASTPCDIVNQRVTYAPGGFSGWHSHPGVVLVVITAGSVTRYASDCTKTTYTVGQAFLELGRDQIIYVRNEGSTPAEVLATFIVPAGTANADLRIDQPAPANCTP
jgi:hypothetical protein